jgi:CRISPR/Cas system-associated exonuclease Cas4 (RecB family)
LSRAWSISALSAFETCPKRYYMVSVAKKFSEPPSEAMTWGSTVHKAFEDYFKSEKRFPLGMESYEGLARKMRIAGQQGDEMLVESSLALNQKLQPVGYFDRDVWVRSRVDFGILKSPQVMVVDWKTGKRKESDDQLALMAGMILALRDDVQKVVSTFVWLQEPQDQQVEKKLYARDQVGEIWNRFLPRVERFQEAFRKDEFPTRPSGICRKWCPVKTCPHNGT